MILAWWIFYYIIVYGSKQLRDDVSFMYILVLFKFDNTSTYSFTLILPGFFNFLFGYSFFNNNTRLTKMV